MVPLRRLAPAEWNANRVPDKTLAKIRRSIEEFGFVENLVARRHPVLRGKLEVLSGNHRLKLLGEMGFSEAPVVVVDVGDADARILAQALNRTRGEDDPEAYARLLESVLGEVDAARVIEFLPESEGSIDRVLRAMAVWDADPDDAPPLPAEPRSRFGEVYQLGPHLLMCGDATDPDQVRTLFEPPAHHGLDAVDVVWTDPPYGVAYVGKTDAKLTIQNDQADGLQALLVDAFHAIGPALADHARFYVAGPAGGTRPRDFLEAIDTADWRLHQILVWVKNRMVLGHSDYHFRHEFLFYGWTPTRADSDAKGRPGRGVHHGTRWYGGNDQTSVLEYDAPTKSEEHPTMKPVELIEHCLGNSSARGGIVYDPFGGSGSTLIACHRIGRRARLVEIDPAYCDVIRDRYEKFVGDRT